MPPTRQEHHIPNKGVIMLAAVCLFGGIGIGAASQDSGSDSTRTSAAAPAPIPSTVTVTTTEYETADLPEPTPTKAKARPKPQPHPTKQAPAAPKTDPRFGTCTEAKAHGYGPYVEGVDPEYSWYIDRDGDGTVCE